jgi:hypothetical protein
MKIGGEKKKKKKKIGGGSNHPLGQNGVIRPSHFLARGGWSHPYGWSEDGRTTPMPKGVVRPPPKKKGVKMGFRLLGVARPPPRAWGGFGHPIPAKPLKVVRPPSKPILTHFSFSFFLFLFFSFGLLRVAKPPTWVWGWFDHPQTNRGGGFNHPLAKNGVAGPPHFGQVGATPDFHFKNNKKINKLTKRHHFGLGGCCSFGT